MYTYMLITIFNGHIQNNNCYTDRDKAVEAYEKAKKSYLSLGTVCALKEDHRSIGLFGDSFGRTYTGKVTQPGYKTACPFVVRLACRLA